MNPLEYIAKLATQTKIKVIPAHKDKRGNIVPKSMSKTTKLDTDTFKALLKYQQELNKGLATFRSQVEIPTPPKKNHVHYWAKGHLVDYYYVDLSTLVTAINKGLKGTGKGRKDTGLSFTQDSKHLNNLEIVIFTVIRSNSGWQNTVAPVYLKTSSLYPQDVGGALTYAKRYSLSTAFGVPSQTDDDYRPDRHTNQSSTIRSSQSSTNQRSRRQAPVMSKAQWKAHQAKQPASTAQVDAIDRMVRQWSKINNNVTVAKADNYLAKTFNFGKNMTKANASNAISSISSFISQDKAKEAADKAKTIKARKEQSKTK